MDYPVSLERDDNRTVLVHFPDFPEAHTFGEDEAEALRRAKDALSTVIDAYIKDRRDIPAPSRPGRLRLPVPALVEAKIHLYEAMRTSRVGKAELARRLGWHLPQIDRLLEMKHASRLQQLEAAFEALGKRLVVGVVDSSAARPKRAVRRRLPRRHGPRVAAADRRRRSRHAK